VGAFVGILFDGLAYGSLLFLISLGLSVTMGLMNFVNLAHGAFAMLGGFLCIELTRRLGMPFLLTLPVVFVAVGLTGAALERLLYRRLYARSPLDQVLFTIGFAFMAGAAATRVWGPSQQPVELPAFLRGQLTGVRDRSRRLPAVSRRAGGRDHRRAGSVPRPDAVRRAAARRGRQPASGGRRGRQRRPLFSVTFALGSGLAGLGGALAIDVLGLDPTFALKYLVYFSVVVVVGGAGSIKGSLVAAVLLGVADVAGKYYVPQIGSFIIYAAMVALLIVFPAGLYGRRS
jgi:branched-chain amino acid transport system permease protein